MVDLLGMYKDVHIPDDDQRNSPHAPPGLPKTAKSGKLLKG
jgi:hypothetical protein